MLEISTQALHSLGKHLAKSVFESLQERGRGPVAGGCRPVGGAKSGLLCRVWSAERQSRLFVLAFRVRMAPLYCLANEWGYKVYSKRLQQHLQHNAAALQRAACSATVMRITASCSPRAIHGQLELNAW